MSGNRSQSSSASLGDTRFDNDSGGRQEYLFSGSDHRPSSSSSSSSSSSTSSASQEQQESEVEFCNRVDLQLANEEITSEEWQRLINNRARQEHGLDPIPQPREQHRPLRGQLLPNNEFLLPGKELRRAMLSSSPKDLSKFPLSLTPANHQNSSADPSSPDPSSPDPSSPDLSVPDSSTAKLVPFTKSPGISPASCVHIFDTCGFPCETRQFTDADYVYFTPDGLLETLWEMPGMQNQLKKSPFFGFSDLEIPVNWKVVDNVELSIHKTPIQCLELAQLTATSELHRLRKHVKKHHKHKLGEFDKIMSSGNVSALHHFAVDLPQTSKRHKKATSMLPSFNLFSSDFHLQKQLNDMLSTFHVDSTNVNAPIVHSRSEALRKDFDGSTIAINLNPKKKEYQAVTLLPPNGHDERCRAFLNAALHLVTHKLIKTGRWGKRKQRLKRLLDGNEAITIQRLFIELLGSRTKCQEWKSEGYLKDADVVALAKAAQEWNPEMVAADNFMSTVMTQYAQTLPPWWSIVLQCAYPIMLFLAIFVSFWFVDPEFISAVIALASILHPQSHALIVSPILYPALTLRKWKHMDEGTWRQYEQLRRFVRALDTSKSTYDVVNKRFFVLDNEHRFIGNSNQEYPYGLAFGIPSPGQTITIYGRTYVQQELANNMGEDIFILVAQSPPKQHNMRNFTQEVANAQHAMLQIEFWEIKERSALREFLSNKEITAKVKDCTSPAMARQSGDTIIQHTTKQYVIGGDFQHLKTTPIITIADDGECDIETLARSASIFMEASCHPQLHFMSSDDAKQFVDRAILAWQAQQRIHELRYDYEYQLDTTYMDSDELCVFVAECIPQMESMFPTLDSLRVSHIPQSWKSLLRTTSSGAIRWNNFGDELKKLPKLPAKGVQWLSQGSCHQKIQVVSSDVHNKQGHTPATPARIAFLRAKQELAVKKSATGIAEHVRQIVNGKSLTELAMEASDSKSIHVALRSKAKKQPYHCVYSMDPLNHVYENPNVPSLLPMTQILTDWVVTPIQDVFLPEPVADSLALVDNSNMPSEQSLMTQIFTDCVVNPLQAVVKAERDAGVADSQALNDLVDQIARDTVNSIDSWRQQHPDQPFPMAKVMSRFDPVLAHVSATLSPTSAYATTLGVHLSMSQTRAIRRIILDVFTILGLDKKDPSDLIVDLLNRRKDQNAVHEQLRKELPSLYKSNKPLIVADELSPAEEMAKQAILQLGILEIPPEVADDAESSNRSTSSDCLVEPLVALRLLFASNILSRYAGSSIRKVVPSVTAESNASKWFKVEDTAKYLCNAVHELCLKWTHPANVLGITVTSDRSTWAKGKNTLQAWNKRLMNCSHCQESSGDIANCPNCSFLFPRETWSALQSCRNSSAYRLELSSEFESTMGFPVLWMFLRVFDGRQINPGQANRLKKGFYMDCNGIMTFLNSDMKNPKHRTRFLLSTGEETDFFDFGHFKNKSARTIACLKETLANYKKSSKKSGAIATLFRDIITLMPKPVKTIQELFFEGVDVDNSEQQIELFLDGQVEKMARKQDNPVGCVSGSETVQCLNEFVPMIHSVDPNQDTLTVNTSWFDKIATVRRQPSLGWVVTLGRYTTHNTPSQRHCVKEQARRFPDSTKRNTKGSQLQHLVHQIAKTIASMNRSCCLSAPVAFGAAKFRSAYPRDKVISHLADSGLDVLKTHEHGTSSYCRCGERLEKHAWSVFSHHVNRFWFCLNCGADPLHKDSVAAMNIGRKARMPLQIGFELVSFTRLYSSKLQKIRLEMFKGDTTARSPAASNLEETNVESMN